MAASFLGTRVSKWRVGTAAAYRPSVSAHVATRSRLTAVFTLASIPKPFAGATGQAQERAVASWLELGHDVQIVLVGDDEGVSDVASRLQVDHVGGVARNAHGTPRLDDALRRVDGIARHRIRCLVNADIVLLPDLIPAVERVASASAQFLLVGQSRDVVVGDDEITAPEALRRRALSSGTTRGPTAIDWFVFPAGLFDPMPPFAIGRAAFDNWLIWRARQAGPVIDATEAVVAIHQPHAYGHLGGGKDEAYYGEEADENRRLAGGRSRVYTLHDASHKLGPNLSLHRNPGSILRVRETARKAAWKLGLR